MCERDESHECRKGSDVWHGRMPDDQIALVCGHRVLGRLPVVSLPALRRTRLRGSVRIRLASSSTASGTSSPVSLSDGRSCPAGSESAACPRVTLLRPCGPPHNCATRNLCMRGVSSQTDDPNEIADHSSVGVVSPGATLLRCRATGRASRVTACGPP